VSKKLFVLVLLAGLLLTVFGGAAAQQGTEGFLRYPISVDPEQLNPFVSDTIAVGTVTRNIFEGLTRYNADTNEVEPALAESWEVTDNEDGTQTYTFNLRQGVLFHDVAGVDLEDREVTADDIIWNYTTALNPDESVSIQSGNPFLQSIAGAAEFVAGEADSVSGIEAVDDYTVAITLREPNRLFLINGMVSIFSPEAYEELGDGVNSTPVGTGPYQFVEWRRDDRLILEANPDYYIDGLPRNPGIIFINYPEANTALLDYREGNLDFLFAFPTGQRQAIIDEFTEEFEERPGLHQRYWGYNMESGFLADKPLLRQAFHHALDKDTAWTVIAEGARFPADLGFLPPSMPASTPSVTYPFDLNRAAELMEEAGYPNGEGLPPIRIYLLSSIANEGQVVIWQQALESLGVQVEFTIEDSATYFDTIANSDEVDISQNGWAAGLSDPSDVFDYLIYDGAGSSFRYDNDEVDALLDQARNEQDEDVRNDLYQQAHNIIMEEAVVIPSGYSKISWLQKPYISGFNPGGGGTYTAPLWLVERSAD
jgi:ABC-type transport system substrate-binding protein